MREGSEYSTEQISTSGLTGTRAPLRLLVPRSECVSQLFIAGQIPKKNNLEEERLIFIHSLRGFSPWSDGSILLALR